MSLPKSSLPESWEDLPEPPPVVVSLGAEVSKEGADEDEDNDNDSGGRVLKAAFMRPLAQPSEHKPMAGGGNGASGKSFQSRNLNALARPPAPPGPRYDGVRLLVLSKGARGAGGSAAAAAPPPPMAWGGGAIAPAVAGLGDGGVAPSNIAQNCGRCVANLQTDIF